MNEAEVEQLLRGARGGVSEQLGRLLQLYRNYLTILAATQVSAKLRPRVSPSDVVQETVLAAHRDFEQFRGETEREFVAWLRQILINTVHHLVEQHFRAKRRNIRREISLQHLGDSLDRSAAAFVAAFVDPGPSPSEAARQREASVVLAEQLAQLRPQYREVIVLRNLQGLSFDEVARRMNRSSNAVRMLWLRAIEKFRQVYQRAE